MVSSIVIGCWIRFGQINQTLSKRYLITGFKGKIQRQHLHIENVVIGIDDIRKMSDTIGKADFLELQYLCQNLANGLDLLLGHGAEEGDRNPAVTQIFRHRVVAWLVAEHVHHI